MAERRLESNSVDKVQLASTGGLGSNIVNLANLAADEVNHAALNTPGLFGSQMSPILRFVGAALGEE